jgi:hypothetical protein
MSEITLTGGTMVPSTHGHSHSHGHSHGHSHSHGGGGSIEMMDTPTMDDIANASMGEIIRTFSTLMRFGRYEALQPLIEKIEEQQNKRKGDSDTPPIQMVDILQQSDDGGHSLFHWAAKRVDDIRFLQCATDLAVKYQLTPKIMNITSKDNVGMRPLHWACTEGSIPHAALLLKNGADIEAKDNSGCTPLLIAAQYGQVEVVAYLLKKGANIQAVDTSWDSALHWAAYKGKKRYQYNVTVYSSFFF